MNSKYIMLLMMPVLVTAGQLLLKKSMHAVVTGKGIVPFALSILHPGIIAAVICVAGAPLLYINALEIVPLSEAFAFNSLNYILVFVTGGLILKERVNLLQIIGVILISSGFILPIIIEAAGA